MKRTLLALLLIATAGHAADTITVGTVTASGNTADVPVYIRDASGTPLGVDQPAGSRIQAFSIKVSYAPASAVQSVTFSRAGITANLTPSFESSPSSSGAVSLLETFQESTNPIPFTLNAAAPGDQVAHLVFTLSSSAAPGSTISLTLDPTLTQLTDQGGTAATKETTTNGNLTLVNGAVTAPNMTVSFVPSPLNLLVGANGNGAVVTSAPVPGTTTVTLSSSAPSIAKVPASVDIVAGSSSASFTVNALATGNARVTATLPASLGGATAALTVNVTTQAVCNTPPAPSISGPGVAEVGAAYTIAWSAVSDATEYFIDEATSPDFSNAATHSLTGTSATFSQATNNITYFYRVRAHNHGGTCDLTSANSNVVAVLVGHAAATPMQILPVVGSTPGSNNSYFRTSVQMYNPKSVNVSGKIIFHSTNAADVQLAYSIAPGKTLAYADLLPAMGVASGLGTADLVPDATSAAPVAIARVFNDAGAAGTSGLTYEPLDLAAALQTGDTGVLLAPADVTKFRLNIGVRTLTDGVSMTIVVRDKDGNTVKTATQSYGPTSFTQPGAAAITGYTLTGGETISFSVTGGSAFVYGATTDNTTNDPSVQFARPVS